MDVFNEVALKNFVEIFNFSTENQKNGLNLLAIIALRHLTSLQTTQLLQ